MPNAPVTLTGPPWGGPQEEGYCCGARVYERRMLEENRGQHRSVHKQFVVGDWQCHVTRDHRGTLRPWPLIPDEMKPPLDQYLPLDTEYLRYVEETKAGRKTRTFRVVSRRWNDTLGFIKWYGQWRQYAFFPSAETVWNPDCLRSIEATCIGLMEQRRLDRLEVATRGG
jgi:hypothetical protein